MAKRDRETPKTNPVCSFCGKHHREVRLLIEGPGVDICSECVSKCNQLMADAGAPAN